MSRKRWFRHPNRRSLQDRQAQKKAKNKCGKGYNFSQQKKLLEHALLSGLWYKIFGLLSLSEAVRLLERFARAKRNQVIWCDKHYEWRNYHHLVPVSRGGRTNFRNLGLMRVARHTVWHMVFGLMTLEEVAQFLCSMDKLWSSKCHYRKASLSLYTRTTNSLVA